MLHATIEGNLFSRDFLSRLLDSGASLSYTSPDSYGLGTTKTREAIAQSWNALSGRFARFHSEFHKLSATDSATTLTRREWLLPLLQELGFGRVQSADAIETPEKSYPISHGWNQTPIHLLGVRIALDKRTPNVQGAATQAPHALVQEALNRSDAHLWGLVSNGLKLRLLRDSASIARLSYVEFDLEAIFQSEDLASFGALWLLCHASRFENNGAILEAWTQLSREEGTRALDRLRDGTQSAIEILGRGFLNHANNKALRDDLEVGKLSNLDFYKYTLRIVYRMLFVLVAESKDALLLPTASDGEKALYQKYFALSKLKDHALKRRGDEHVDLWRGLKVTFGAMRKGEEALAIPALGGFLFEPIPFDDCDISNRDLLAALRALGFFEDSKGQRVAVNFNLGSEELGSVYESLLELSPLLDVHARTFSFALLAGNERKTTGAYYTPEILVKSLLESALEPLLERALKEADSEKALLSLSVLDPACGSGHFLTATTRRIAHQLAYVRTHGEEPTTPQKRAALRDVVSHCIYGIDLNPMAVELCKVALWMEALEPGRPLSFLDSHIRCGNALLGTTPELLEAGLPDDAFKPLDGDDKAVVASLKRINKQEREAIKGRALQGMLFDDEGGANDEWASGFAGLESHPEDTLEQVRAKEERFVQLQQEVAFRTQKLRADAWCAAFVWKRIKDDKDNATEYVAPITSRSLAAIEERGILPLAQQNAEVERLSGLYNWFHPHLEFPLVWEKGGFDLVLGNPPWEQVQFDDREFFAVKRPDIADAANMTARNRAVAKLETQDPDFFASYKESQRQMEGVQHFIHSCDRYPLTSFGRLNTAPLFCENVRRFINKKGRAGIIVPTGIATDSFNQYFFADLIKNQSLVSLFDFQSGPGLFSEVGHARFKFCLLTLTSDAYEGQMEFAFFLRSEADLNKQENRFTLSKEDIVLLNPNTKTCPIFRSRQDAELSKAIYRRVPVLVDESQGEEGNLWGFKGLLMFMMNIDSDKFRTYDELEVTGARLSGNIWRGDLTSHKESGAFLPLYEAKMLHQYDHRWATYADDGETRGLEIKEKSNPAFVVNPRYWMFENHIARRNYRGPRWLADMLESRDEKALQQLLVDWVIGWMFNHGKESEANEFLAKLNWAGVDAVSSYFSRRFALEAHEKNFPLTQEELDILALQKPFEVAQVLFDNRVPEWLIGFRDICRSTDERTVISSLLPLCGTSNTMPLFVTTQTPRLNACVVGNLNSLILDYNARQKVGGTHLTFNYLRQFPILPPSTYDATLGWTNGVILRDWIAERVVELCYTAYDLMPFARDCGYEGEPFTWNTERRFEVRCQLDAAFFVLYGLSLKEAAYVLDTFPIVRRKDEAAHGTYRTKERILELLGEYLGKTS